MSITISALDSNESESFNPSSNICNGCNKIINDKYLLKALDKLWHEDCLKCACCDCRLGIVIKINLIIIYTMILYTKLNN